MPSCTPIPHPERMQCYDPSANSWSTPASLPEHVQASDWSAVSIGDAVYLIGGYDADYNALDRVTVVDMSDLDDVRFSEGPKMNDDRGDIDAVVLDNGGGGQSVYVSGGFTEENDFSSPYYSVEKLDVASRVWSEVDALNEDRGDKQLVSLKGKIYALGGETKRDAMGAIPEDEKPHLGEKSIILDTVEVYDPDEDVNGGKGEWKKLDDMPVALFRFAASPWEVDGGDGFIFVCGGQVGFDADCECFRTTDKVLAFDASQAGSTVQELDNAGVMGAGAESIVPILMVAILWFGF